jgi:hypothetical protein
LAAVDALLRFCAFRCNAKRPNTVPLAQPEQPASLCRHLKHNNELWETDLATADEDASGSGAEVEAYVAAGGGNQQHRAHGDEGGDCLLAWEDGPFVSEEANDVQYWSDQFPSLKSSSPRSSTGA